MIVFIVNCGSSSLKFQLFDMHEQKALATGLADRIGIEPSAFRFEPEGKDTIKLELPIPDHASAFSLAVQYLTDPTHGVISSINEIDAVGHRVVHGGNKFVESALIDESVIDAIKSFIPLGPLHNPANLTGIQEATKLMPNTPQVACFDTAFHQSMPEYAYVYPIPYELYEEYKIRKYGFHGTSHRFITAKAIEMLGNPAHSKIVTCHLGNGSSCAAVLDGKSMDTTMGLTPLEGLAMGTRSGSIDPAIVKFLHDNANMSIDEIDSMLNKKSGALGISGFSNDFRDIESAANEGNERARLALDIFFYRVRLSIGSYAAALGGLDAIVFTAGIGENSSTGREAILKGLEFLGVSIDAQKNLIRGEAIDISMPDASCRVLVIPTNEELMIAQDTEEIVLAAKK
ncbi:MAG: acetate kinase [Eubacteriaceae bacterium]|nr:acetate kinase [Eubacteriaceae bacterium]